MYSLDINFLRDRKPQKSTSSGPRPAINRGDLKPLYIGLAVAVCLPALVAGGWMILQWQNNQLQQNITQLDQENKDLDAKIGNINQVRTEIASVKAQTQSLVSVFDQIRPWSAILQDLRDRIPPTVKIETIRQTPPEAPPQGQPPPANSPKGSPGVAPTQSLPNPAGGLEITGMARSFGDVNDFLLSLQQSSLFNAKDTKIITAELVNAPVPPGITPNKDLAAKPLEVVKYTIKTSLSSVPASELIRELEQKGTVGLVARIRSLQDTGVIQK